MKVVTRFLISATLASVCLTSACSDSSPTSPLQGGTTITRPMLTPSFGEGGTASLVAFHPGNSSDPGASAEASIASLASAAQGVAFKLKVRGDVFTNLGTWDSRTLMSIDDGTFSGRKVELVLERNEFDEIHVFANWTNNVMVQTRYVPVSSFSPAAEYVIYGHYNDAAQPQRELALFDAAGVEMQRTVAEYAAGPLATSAASGRLHVARGLNNWSANGTIDGIAVYVLTGSNGVLTGAARAAVPGASDPGIVSLTMFDEGSGISAANAVAGAPAMALQSPYWSVGGSWTGGVPSAPSTSGGNGSGLATFVPGNSGTAGAVGTASIQALESARQGVAVKLRVKGDVFTGLANWDSRTLLSISDGTYAGRKFELVLERNNAGQVHMRARWQPQEVATEFASVGAFDPGKYYVIYAHYDDAASPQRQIAVFNEAGQTVQEAAQSFPAGDLPSLPQSGIVTLATGLSNWSANGTIDGVAVYVLSGATVVTDGWRFVTPAPTDPGIVSLVTFDEGSGNIAANAVPGAPGMKIPAGSWTSGGAWGETVASPAPVPVQSTPLPAPAPAPPFPSGGGTVTPLAESDAATPLIRYNASGSLPGGATLGKPSFFNYNGYNSTVSDPTAPASPSGVLRFAYPGGAGHEMEEGRPGTEPGNLYIPFAESNEIYESGWFRVGDSDGFEMLGVQIWKPLGFWGNANPAALPGTTLVANQLYGAAWVFRGPDGKITGMRLGIANQTDIADGLSWSYGYGNDIMGAVGGSAASPGLGIDPHPEIPFGQWVHYEIRLKTNSLSPSPRDDGIIQMRVSWGGHSYLIVNRNDVRFRSPRFPRGFFHRQLAPSFGGVNTTATSRTRFDYLYFDDIYLSGVPAQ